MNTPENTLSKELVWNIYDGMTKQCQHFNGLQSTYRGLASTWLLTAFAGIGFILKEFHSGSAAPLLVAGIGAAAASGIFLLWLIDLMVYQRLISAAFTEQLCMEDSYPWLPQVAHRAMRIYRGSGIVPKVVWFYISSYLLLIGIASFSFVTSVGSNWSTIGKILLMAVVLAFAGFWVACYMYSSAVPNTDEQAVFHNRK